MGLSWDGKRAEISILTHIRVSLSDPLVFIKTGKLFRLNMHFIVEKNKKHCK